MPHIGAAREALHDSLRALGQLLIQDGDLIRVEADIDGDDYQVRANDRIRAQAAAESGEPFVPGAYANGSKIQRH